MRFAIVKFCFSRKVVCRFWRLLEGMRYVMRGRFVGVMWSLMTMLFGLSWSWTG